MIHVRSGELPGTQLPLLRKEPNNEECFPHQTPTQHQRQRPSVGGRIVSVSQGKDHTLMWLVTDPHNKRQYSTVTQTDETLHCACQKGQVPPTPCPHLQAVQAWVEAHQHRGCKSISLGKAEKSRQALSWSDNTAFSIWKS